MTVIDCETTKGSEEQLALVKPEFRAPANFRDTDKIKAAIIEAEFAWRERAALSPMTGQILSIGLLNGDAMEILIKPEADMIRDIWYLWDQGNRFVGFNVKEFDFRFLTIRSRILGIKVPDDLFSGRYWSHKITDLQEVFTCYSRDISGYSLDAICKVCGLGSKNGSGKDFAKLFAEDRVAACEYIKRDLLLTQALAQRLGVIP